MKPVITRLRRHALAGALLVSACGTDPNEPSPPVDGGTRTMDVLLAPGAGIGGMIIRLAGARVDSVVGVGTIAGLITSAADTAAFAVAGDDLKQGLVARLFLAAPRTADALSIEPTDVVGGEELGNVRPGTGWLSVRATLPGALASATPSRAPGRQPPAEGQESRVDSRKGTR